MGKGWRGKTGIKEEVEVLVMRGDIGTAAKKETEEQRKNMDNMGGWKRDKEKRKKKMRYQENIELYEVKELNETALKKEDG